MIRLGDLVTVPLPTGETACGWIIYVSQYYKDVIGVLFYDTDQEHFADCDFSKPIRLPIYTSIPAAHGYQWKAIGSRVVDDEAIRQTERIVAGDVWIGDDFVRQASVADRKILPVMQVAGMPVVHDWVYDALPLRSTPEQSKG